MTLDVDLRELLKDRYETKGLRLADIAIELGVDIGTVSRWMQQLGIPRRVRTKGA